MKEPKPHSFMRSLSGNVYPAFQQNKGSTYGQSLKGRDCIWKLDVMPSNRSKCGRNHSSGWRHVSLQDTKYEDWIADKEIMF